MKQLIVNADDFGLTEGVNRGILRAHRTGIVTSATLLANGAAFDAAVAAAREEPRLAVGVHLNLTEGRPVLDPCRVPSLVNEEGEFYGQPLRLVGRILSRQVNRTEVERELGAQIEKVLHAGIGVTHLDGHKHVHLLPTIPPIVARLARQYGIGGVRLAVERPVGLGGLLRRQGTAAITVVKQSLRARAFAGLAIEARTHLQLAGLAYPMYFYGLAQTGLLGRAALEAILRDVPPGSSELMCHPGYADSALSQTPTRLREQREIELNALTSPEILQLVSALGIQLINYRDLTAA